MSSWVEDNDPHNYTKGLLGDDISYEGPTVLGQGQLASPH